MSQNQSLPQDAVAPPRQISIRFDQLKRAPALTVIGLPELIGLAGAALLLLIVVFSYFYFYRPAELRLKSLDIDRQRLQAQLAAYRLTVNENETTRESVNKIIDSLGKFEGRWLVVQGPGRMSLYEVLNDLIKKNGIRNTAGPSYSTLPPVGEKQSVQPSATAQQQTNAKWQSIYPGIAVSVTVEGPYQNVRHFVHDLESSRQFLIINAVELERVNQTGANAESPSQFPTRPEAAPPNDGGKGGLVSLRIDLATYFQRPESKPANE